jgi:hypothetical protein
MNVRVVVVACASCSACSGAVFQLDERLGGTTPLSVTGPLGANNAEHCDSHNPPPTEGLAANRAAEVVIGPLSGVASEPHRKITSTPLFREAVARDYERFLAKNRDRDSGRLIALLLALLGAGDVTRPMEPGEDPPDAARFLLTLPGESKQVMTFTFLATREGRAISAACSSTDVARAWGFYDGPHFAMRCRIVSSADRALRELNVSGHGSFAKFSFRGELRSVEPSSQRAVFQAQDVTLLGIGVVQGFEIRSTAEQLGAVSFYQERDSNGHLVPRAWVLPRLDPGWSDVVFATLALSYVYPWPTSCDARHLASQRG